jgi:hypothetical protein
MTKGATTVAPSSSCNGGRNYGRFVFVAAFDVSVFVESILCVESIFIPVSVPAGAGAIAGAGAAAAAAESCFAWSFFAQAATASTAATRARRFMQIS